ncbi:hypothetical protein A4A71_05035 [Nicoletella semolina]|nr:2-succinyl-6-hydroxy-2,4-cyclohexadiene-1-carboxylate synthase [Nicoletella semolina]MDH2924712.1 hypothetical protein [Nicoletella semolina]
MLAYQWHARTGIPVVFLHGLLGSQADWSGVLVELQRLVDLQKLPQIRPLVIDLPCHGGSQQIACRGFSEIRQALDMTLNKLIQQPFWLVGYSLGGRIALDYAINASHSPHSAGSLYLLGALLEGANIGLKTEEERQLRWKSDQAWASRFRQETLSEVLKDWYRQPVFAHLSALQRLNLIDQRTNNDGKKIAQILEATSLAKQPCYDQLCNNLVKSHRLHKRFHFFIGEFDRKFRQMATENHLSHTLIREAGHNTHLEQPQQFVQQLLQFIGTHSSSS